VTSDRTDVAVEAGTHSELCRGELCGSAHWGTTDREHVFGFGLSVVSR